MNILRIAVAYAIVLASEAARMKVHKKGGSSSGTCADPLSAILETMGCFDDEDSSCADGGYSRSGFDEYHNSVKVSLPAFPADRYASTAMKYYGSNRWLNFQENLGKNQAEVRYIKNIRMSDGSDFGLQPSRTYPFNATFKQYVHAIVTTDADCRIIRWDQYGDNKEQSDFNDALDAMIALVGINPSLTETGQQDSAALAEESSSSIETQSTRACADPVSSIVRIMTCIENKDSGCANSGYNWLRFNKYHNGKNAGVQLWPLDIYWRMAMKFSTFILDYDHLRNIDAPGSSGKASVRYIETVKMSDGTDFELEPSNTWPFNSTIIQHEHALVEVDNDCKITRWDQYGDNEEQAEVDTAMDAFMANQGVKCNLGLALPWQC